MSGWLLSIVGGLWRPCIINVVSPMRGADPPSCHWCCVYLPVLPCVLVIYSECIAHAGGGTTSLSLMWAVCTYRSCCVCWVWGGDIQWTHRPCGGRYHLPVAPAVRGVCGLRAPAHSLLSHDGCRTTLLWTPLLQVSYRGRRACVLMSHDGSLYIVLVLT